MIIDESEDMPPSSLYMHRFGGLLRAYRLIGYIPERGLQICGRSTSLRAMHSDIVRQTVADIEALRKKNFCRSSDESVEMNHHLFISIVISRCFITASGLRR